MSPPDLRKQLVKITTSAPDDWTSRIVAAASGNGPASDTSDDDPANAGIRREPELPEHEEIIRAIEKGDADLAEKAMIKHLERSRALYALKSSKP